MQIWRTVFFYSYAALPAAGGVADGANPAVRSAGFGESQAAGAGGEVYLSSGELLPDDPAGGPAGPEPSPRLSEASDGCPEFAGAE